MKQSIYEDWKAGDLTKAEYTEYKASYAEKLAALERRLDALSAQKAEPNPWLARLSALESPTELTRELAAALIEEITVFSETRIRIQFKFSDALADAETALQKLAT